MSELCAIPVLRNQTTTEYDGSRLDSNRKSGSISQRVNRELSYPIIAALQGDGVVFPYAGTKQPESAGRSVFVVIEAFVSCGTERIHLW